MAIEKVLLVEDDALMRTFLIEVFCRKKWHYQVADSAKKGIDLLQQEAFDLMICDIKLPDFSGIDVLKVAKQLHPKIIAILTTAYASIENAVEAMRLGAFNYLIKPFPSDSLETVIERAEEHLSLLEENELLRKEVISQYCLDKSIVIAQSVSMKQILLDVEKIAKSSASVFISGESGTGKEVIANTIHHLSHRTQKPFIRVNCAAIPGTLLESEFFGHEKGSFTGALNRRIGRFELAHQGTLLLDEISEIPLELQPKLLRAIQEQEFERLGGSKPVQVDVRIIATSNRNMKDAIEKKLFREDLYYRLNVVPIQLPPLRERKEDIAPLSEYFLDKFCRENQKRKKYFQKEAVQKLEKYFWPGNIRELSNIIERTVVMSSCDAISEGDILIESSCPVPSSIAPAPKVVTMTLSALEQSHILSTLEKCNRNRTRAAKELGISIRTLRNKLKLYQEKN